MSHCKTSIDDACADVERFSQVLKKLGRVQCTRCRGNCYLRDGRKTVRCPRCDGDGFLLLPRQRVQQRDDC